MTNCFYCGKEIKPGDLVGCDPETGEVTCFECADTLDVEVNRTATDNVHFAALWYDAWTKADRARTLQDYRAAVIRFAESVDRAVRIGGENKRAWIHPRVDGDEPEFYSPKGQRLADLAG